MTTFNIVFGIALVFTLVNLFITSTYLSSIKGALIIASGAVLSDLLKDNNHFKCSREKARKEYGVLTNWWMPLSWSAVCAVCVAWWTGSSNNQLLADGDVLWLVIALTPLIARYYTHKIDYSWLAVWVTGMEAVMVSIQMKLLETKISELESIENPTTMTLNQIEFLKYELEKFRHATGIESSQLGSVNEEQ